MALSHIVLHTVLCNSAMRAKNGTAFPGRVTVVDRVNDKIVDQPIRVVRDFGGTATIAFDSSWGTYYMQTEIRTPAGPCSASQFLVVEPDTNRVIDQTLSERPPKMPTPILVFGTVPIAFAYVQPTVVVFPKTLQCNGAVGDPLDMSIETQNDAGGYYATVYPRPELVSKDVVVAIRLTDARGDYKYVRVPQKMMTFSMQWPSTTQFKVEDNMIDFLADKPADTLLCPKMYETITH